jgi:hypothetical protein
MMHLGLLDLPAPILDWVDGILAAIPLPAVVRLLLYGGIAGWLSMLLYRHTSPQQRLTALRAELATVQSAVIAHDGDFGEMQRLIWRQLSLSLRQLGLTLAPALIGALPLLFSMPWISNHFELTEPAAGQSTSLCAYPIDAAKTLHWPTSDVAEDGCWNVNWPQPSSSMSLSDANHRDLLALPLPVPTAIVHKFHAFNWLVANPAGYLPDDAAVDTIRIDMPTRIFLPWGPTWMRGWELPFFFAVFAVSIALKWRWKLH